MPQSGTKADRSDARTILATDCGSTTTKAILIEKQGDEFRLVVRGEAPTTVEAPFEDVTMGVRNSVREVEELAGRTLLDKDGVIVGLQDGTGVDLFVSTSSAGGGLQMMVAGVVKNMTAESAHRAALGAGAIVMDVIAVDDGRLPHQKIQRVRELRPDMILLSGGIDGGTISHVVELAELVAAAEPRPRLGIGFQLPLIYAGNTECRDHVKRLLGEMTDLRIVDNLRPVLELEVLGPAREEIHNLFMEHVMAQAPGYNKLMSWTEVPIMPTPGAVGLLVETVAREFDMSVIGVDIGGATTDVFSVFEDSEAEHRARLDLESGGEGLFESNFNRTVSANLGMSYSMCNVLLEAGLENIKRWLPFEMDDGDLRNRIRNKMIRPTTIPHTLEELVIEQSVAREALRLAFVHHGELATGLHGVRLEKKSLLDPGLGGESLIDLMGLGMLVGSGGVLSHAPRRVQAALMMLDAFQPEGITKLAVDSIFMMPQLGILSTVLPEAAAQVFDRDCLVRLGTSIAPKAVRTSSKDEGGVLADVSLTWPDGTVTEETIVSGEIRIVELGEGQRVQVDLAPARGVDVGAGRGSKLSAEVEGGVVGLILDGRGRPLALPAEGDLRRQALVRWFKSVGAYDAELIESKWETAPEGEVN